MLTTIPSIQLTDPVADAVLLVVVASLVDVLIVAVFTNVAPEVSVVFNTQVTINIPPLLAGNAPRAKLVADIVTCPFIVSVMSTSFATLPQLFP